MAQVLAMDALAARFDEANHTGDYAGALESLAYSWAYLTPTHGGEVRALLDSLPPETWTTDPWFIAAYGSTFRSIDSPGPIAGLPYFDAAESAHTPHTPAAIRVGVALHHSAALRSIGRFRDAIDVARTALTLSREDGTLQLEWRISFDAKLCLQLGIAHYHLGEFDTALAHLQLAAGLAEKALFPSERLECFAALAMLAYSMGDFGLASAHAQRAAEQASGTPLLESCFGAGALIPELLIAVEQNRLDDARALIPVVTRASHSSDWQPLGCYAIAAVSIISEEYVDGLDALRDCLQAYRGWPEPGAIVTMSEGLRATLLMRLGETDSAWDILDSLAPTEHHANCPARFIAHLRFVTGDSRGALDALRECESLGDTHSSRTLVDVQLIKAAANLDFDNLGGSDVAFDRALSLAARNDMRIPFRLVPADVMSTLIERAEKRTQSVKVAEMLAHVTGSGPKVDDAPQLTDRERDIIRLAARDLAVTQIADELFISTNTVKSHLRSVYRKLGVNSRREAKKRARELGLHVGPTFK